MQEWIEIKGPGNDAFETGLNWYRFLIKDTRFEESHSLFWGFYRSRETEGHLVMSSSDYAIYFKWDGSAYTDMETPSQQLTHFDILTCYPREDWHRAVYA